MKKCFVVCPIGKDESPERKRSDTVLRHIIEPVCKSLGFEVIRVDKIHDVDKIDNTILEYLSNSDLVVADLTDHNPNAFYEVGFRHALNKPLIPIMLEGTQIPFDLSSVRTISYVTDDLDKVDAIKKRLEDTIISLNIQESSETTDGETPKSNEINPIPYLLNIEDAINELKSLVLSKNDDLIEKLFNLSVTNIQKNSGTPESRAMESLFTALINDPSKADEFMAMTEKINKIK